MRHTNLLLYNRYTKTDEGKVKKVKKEKFPRGVCLSQTLKEGNFTDFDTFIVNSDAMYIDQNEGKESNIPETFRIWRIICPVLIDNGIDVPEELQ